MDKGDGSIKYILTGEGAGTTFTIDDSTGDIHAIQRLDREVKAQYVLRAQARNRLTDRPLEPESEFIVKIQDINDNEPKFLDGPYQASVPEMSKIGERGRKLKADRWTETETKLCACLRRCCFSEHQQSAHRLCRVNVVFCSYVLVSICFIQYS